jgi:hypothetical protein
MMIDDVCYEHARECLRSFGLRSARLRRHRHSTATPYRGNSGANNLGCRHFSIVVVHRRKELYGV